MELVTKFTLETAAGLVGVFTAVVLALWTERRRRARAEAEEQARLANELARSRTMVLTSVVKNTSEAKRLRNILDEDDDHYLFDVSFELAVWEATHAQFVNLAPLNERVLLSRFFDQVRRLVRLVEFHRQVRSQLEVRQVPLDSGDRALQRELVRGLLSAAEEVRLDGIILVTDLGETMHKRLLGLYRGGVTTSEAGQSPGVAAQEPVPARAVPRTTDSS